MKYILKDPTVFVSDFKLKLKKKKKNLLNDGTMFLVWETESLEWSQKQNGKDYKKHIFMWKFLVKTSDHTDVQALLSIQLEMLNMELDICISNLGEKLRRALEV